MSFRLCTLLIVVSVCSARGDRPDSDPGLERGEAIYRKLCAECHGTQGEGVEDEYDEPLYGDRTVADLGRLIHRTMPDGYPDLCADDDAVAVAKYIHGAFYSEEARARNKPVKIELSRLTATQHRQSIADLIASFRPRAERFKPGGLLGRYYDDRRTRRDKLKLERVDPELEFAFGAESPHPELIQAEAFAIEWTGSLRVEESGTYEFCVATENGFRLFVNADSDKALIDGWVSSGEFREQRAALPLLAGRAYPVRLEYFKFKEESASIALRWKPPHGVEDLIPARNLSRGRVPPVAVISAPFPADDRSMGYVRGTSVSKAWHEATTRASVETAAYVNSQLESLIDAPRGEEVSRDKTLAFCHDFAARALRRPLSGEEGQRLIDAWFNEDTALADSVKRAVLRCLTSPYFLFPELGAQSDPRTAASRLALLMHDSLPAGSPEEETLTSRDAVREAARRMLDHPLTRAKVRGFLHHWLHLDEEHDLSKDAERFPDFDRQTMTAMRNSLNAFLDAVVWSDASDFRQLLLADYLYLNGSLANFLGQSARKHRDFRKVAFDPQARSGVLTHPYLLARFSYHQQTSPIHRGVFLTRKVLGRSLKPPPEAVQFEDGLFDPQLTMREKVTELTKADSCMTCHAIINPLGFSLEYFDATGRFRYEEDGRPIDAASKYTTHDGRVIDFRRPRDVAEYAAGSESAQRAFIQHLFEHFVKQPVNAYGAGTLERLHRAFEASQFNIQELIVEVVTLAACHELFSNSPNSTEPAHDKNA